MSSARACKYVANGTALYRSGVSGKICSSPFSDADHLSCRAVVHLQESLADVLAAVNRLEPSARFRLPLSADRELAREGVQSRINLLRPGAHVVRQGMQVGRERHGLVPEGCLG